MIKNRHGRVGVHRPVRPSPTPATITAAEANRLRVANEHAIGGLEAIVAICLKSRAKDAGTIHRIAAETLASIGD